MKIAVIGPGALGCLIAGFLKHRAKEDVWLVDKRQDRAKEIAERGVSVEGLGSSFTVKCPITADPKEIGVCDLVVVCVKSYSTEDACKEMKDLVGENSFIMTLQNGIGNVQILNDAFGEARIIAGVTNNGATLKGVGAVRFSGRGETIIGNSEGKLSIILKNAQTAFARAGFETKISKNVDSIIWSKLIINVGINAIGAVTRLANGRLIEYDGTRELLRSSVQEAYKIVKRKRIKLTYDDPIQKVESVCKATADNISSMLQDVLNKKRTEIDFINGAIVRYGKSLGIATPVNEIFTNLVKTIESSYQHGN